MTVRQPTIPGLEPPKPEDGNLVREVLATIEALRDAGALQPWHRGLCAAAIHAARDAEQLGGIARTNQLAQVKDLLKALPEPVVEERGEVLEYEGDRIRAYLEEFDRAHAAAAADDQDAEISAPV